MKINPLSILVINNNQRDLTLEIIGWLDELEYPSFYLIVLESDIYPHESVRDDLKNINLPYRHLFIDFSDNLASSILAAIPLAMANGSSWLLVMSEMIGLSRSEMNEFRNSLKGLNNASIVFFDRGKRGRLMYPMRTPGDELAFYEGTSGCFRIKGIEPQSIMKTGFYGCFELADYSLACRALGAIPYTYAIQSKRKGRRRSVRDWYFLGRNCTFLWKTRYRHINLPLLRWRIGWLWLRLCVSGRLAGGGRGWRQFMRGWADGRTTEQFGV